MRSLQPYSMTPEIWLIVLSDLESFGSINVPENHKRYPERERKRLWKLCTCMRADNDFPEDPMSSFSEICFCVTFQSLL